MQKDNIRYSRLAALPEIGQEGLKALKEASVLVIGCGALGSMCAMYLAASGIGRIGIADFDTIDISNLQRQLFFGESSLGKAKTDVLAARMKDINSEVKVEIIEGLVTEKWAVDLFMRYDFIIDGSDNPVTKMTTCRIASSLGKPHCIGGVKGFSGQVTSWLPGCARYSDIFGEETACNGMTPCSAGGVLGPAAGVVASVQAAEAIKYAAHCGSLLRNRLFTINLLDGASAVYSL